MRSTNVVDIFGNVIMTKRTIFKARMNGRMNVIYNDLIDSKFNPTIIHISISVILVDIINK